jgi:hypothetical protein
MVVQLLKLSAIEAEDDIAPLLHPEMRTYAAPGVAPAGPYETREDFLEYFAQARASGVLVEPDACDIRISPSGAVLAAGSLRLTSSGTVETTPAWFVYTFRDGLIDSLESHLEGDLARKAAGFAPSTSPGPTR